MADHQIQTCSWTDMDDLQSLSANALRNSPLTNALLTKPAGSNRSNTVHTRHTLAHFIYLQALQAQEATASTSKVIKAINTRKPTRDMQGCAWLQWYRSDADDYDGVVVETPDCIDSDTWKYIEDVRHSSRKTIMKGEGHYFIRTLDFSPNIEGWNAAREILSRIHRMDTQYPIIILTQTEHENLYRELDWQHAGRVVFEAVQPLVGRGRYGLQAWIRPGSAERGRDVMGGS